MKYSVKYTIIRHAKLCHINPLAKEKVSKVRTHIPHERSWFIICYTNAMEPHSETQWSSFLLRQYKNWKAGIIVCSRLRTIVFVKIHTWQPSECAFACITDKALDELSRLHSCGNFSPMRSSQDQWLHIMFCHINFIFNDYPNSLWRKRQCVAILFTSKHSHSLKASTWWQPATMSPVSSNVPKLVLDFDPADCQYDAPHISLSL